MGITGAMTEHTRFDPASMASWEGDTEELPVAIEDGPAVNRVPRRGSLLGGITGLLTAALVLLALVMVAAEVFSSLRSWPGPGVLDVSTHVVGAVLAVLLQRQVDHRVGRARRLAAIGVLLVAALIGVLLWWGWLWLFWPV